MKNNLENNQKNNYKKYIFILLILFTISMLLLLLFKLDINNFFSKIQAIGKKEFELYNINKDLWLSIIIPVITVWGTYYFTDKSNKKQIAFQEQKYKEEKEFQKLMAYKSMNKNNIENLYSSLNTMYENNMYILDLYNIDKRYKLEGVFDYDIKQALRETKTFMIQLKEDFYYKEDLVIAINDFLYTIEQNGIEKNYINFMFKVLDFFYGFDEEEKEKFKSDEIQEKAFKKLWQVTGYKCRCEDIKEKIMYALTIPMSKRGFEKEDIDKITVVKNNKKYLEELTEDFEKRKALNETPKKLKDYIDNYINKNKYYSFDNILRELVDIYEKIYEFRFDINEEFLINKLGDNDEKLIEKFVFQIEKKYSVGKPENYMEDFVKKNKYI